MSSAILSVYILFPLFLLYRYIIHPAFLSPLSQIPNAHFTSPFSNAWIKWQRYRSRENRTVHAAHARLGPVVRLGADEVSVNSVEGVRVAYGEGFDRTAWYGRAFDNYGTPNMFSMISRRAHRERKRMLASVYTKSALHASPEIHKISQTLLMQRFLPILEAAARGREDVDVLEYGLAISIDFITAYLFGLGAGSDFLRDAKTRRRWLDAHHRTKGHGFWDQELPGVTALLGKVGIHLVNPQVGLWFEEVKDLCFQLIRSIGPASLATKPVVYDKLLGQLSPSFDGASSVVYEGLPPQIRLDVASELMDHIMAGTETAGWSLTYITHQLSQHPHIQTSLRSELLSLSSPAIYAEAHPGKRSDQGSDVPSPRQLDALPLLDAVILETLRVHPAVPGPQPRVSRVTTSLGKYAGIPPGTRVGAQAYSLHRNEDVFPEPQAWRPERWLPASKVEKVDMMRWFWAFGSGGQMCIGNHLAMLELKLIVAGIYTNYTTKIVDDRDIEQPDAYTAGPKGNKLILRFDRLE